MCCHYIQVKSKDGGRLFFRKVGKMLQSYILSKVGIWNEEIIFANEIYSRLQGRKYKNIEKINPSRTKIKPYYIYSLSTLKRTQVLSFERWASGCCIRKKLLPPSRITLYGKNVKFLVLNIVLHLQTTNHYASPKFIL